MEIFTLDDFDQTELSLRQRNYYFSFKMVSIILLIFILKFIFKYQYENYIPLFATLYVIILISYPLTKLITKNYYQAIASFYLSTITTIGILIFMSGGIRAPGNIWVSLLPFFGASLLGRRGFQQGILFVIALFATFTLLNFYGYEMYPFKTNDSFQLEFRVNLIIFIFTAIYFTYYHVRSEDEFQIKISREKEKNENLLRILFHDLANPMQTIRMLIKKANTNRTPEELPKIIGQIDKTTLRIIEVLDHVRKIKALEDKKIALEIKPYMLQDCFLKIQEIFEVKLKEKELTLKIENKNDDMTVVLVDQIYFVHQVLGNIISNAIKFSYKGGQISISWEKIGKEIVIIISDHGIGMPNEMLKTVFMTNKHTSRSGTYGEVGTGYGMPLVKNFVEEFKGKIEIKSIEKTSTSKNHGTQIIINLPAV